MQQMQSCTSVLEIDKLKVNFYTYEGVVKAIDEISFALENGETLGIVGETGCGKSVSVLSILRLILPPGRIEGGCILYGTDGAGIDLVQKNDEFMRSVRGNDISMIFQEAGNALNPVLSIGDQVSESFLLHRQQELCESVLKRLSPDVKRDSPYSRFLGWRYGHKLTKAAGNGLKYRRYGRLLKKEALSWSVDLLRSLGIPNPDEVVKRYPHELSGGMQQRVVISMALACNPVVLIADEPTSNLDVTIQAQILQLLEELKERYHSSILFITHDLGVVSEVSDRVVVLYAGTMVEFAEVRELFHNPLHPYTRALLHSVPNLGSKKRLESIGGNVPNLVNPPSGCRFHPRCPHVMEVCRIHKPDLYEGERGEGGGHFAACFLLKPKEGD
jgi:peptide/nickel transport system ATP-binding protein